jgi:hypothetical protein
MQEACCRAALQFAARFNAFALSGGALAALTRAWQAAVEVAFTKRWVQILALLLQSCGCKRFRAAFLRQWEQGHGSFGVLQSLASVVALVCHLLGADLGCMCAWLPRCRLSIPPMLRCGKCCFKLLFCSPAQVWSAAERPGGRGYPDAGRQRR